MGCAMRLCHGLCPLAARVSEALVMRRNFSYEQIPVHNLLPPVFDAVYSQTKKPCAVDGQGGLVCACPTTSPMAQCCRSLAQRTAQGRAQGTAQDRQHRARHRCSLGYSSPRAQGARHAQGTAHGQGCASWPRGCRPAVLQLERPPHPPHQSPSFRAPRPHDRRPYPCACGHHASSSGLGQRGRDAHQVAEGPVLRAVRPRGWQPHVPVCAGGVCSVVPIWGWLG